MSGWGLKDRFFLTGTVTTNVASPDVLGFGGTLFLVEVKAGDSIYLANTRHQVASVTSNTLLTLTANAVATTANAVSYTQQGPKFLNNLPATRNVYSIHRVVGLDIVEAMAPSSRARDLKTPGWNHYITYTDDQGLVRYKAECLVAMSKDWNQAAAGDFFDDNVATDQYITFLSQTANQMKLANAAATIQVAAASVPVGAVITYQWKSSPNGAVYANVTNGGVFSGATTNTLTISNVANLNMNYFIVEASNIGLDTILSTPSIIRLGS